MSSTKKLHDKENCRIFARWTTPGFSAICGITNDELDRYFQDGMECLAKRYRKTPQEIRLELRQRYDGYHFAEDLTDIYNPLSLVNVFASENFRNYWFLSGTPSNIVRLLKSRHRRLSDMKGYRVRDTRLGSESILNGDPLPALYLSGYLTIKAYDLDSDTYTLVYPNGEVERSFVDFLFPLYVGGESTDSEFDTDLFVDDVRNGDPQEFMTRLDSLLRGVPHIGDTEPHKVYFRNTLYLVFKLVGFYIRTEDHTSDGRIDMTVETAQYVYVFEFKVNKSAAEAMKQIRRKEYWKKFAASGKTIYLVAANFNPAIRALDDIEIAQP